MIVRSSLVSCGDVREVGGKSGNVGEKEGSKFFTMRETKVGRNNFDDST